MESIKRIFWIGVKEDENRKNTARIVAINVFGVFISFILFIYALYFYFVNKADVANAVLIAFLFCLTPVFLNYLNKTDTARYIYNLNAAPLIYYYSYLIGAGMGIENFHIITFAYPFVFLKKEEKFHVLFFFFYNSLFLFLSKFVPLTFIEPLEFSEDMILFIELFLYTICCIHACIFYYFYSKSVQLTESELIEARNKAERASSVKQDFLAAMSHEIRTPLNVVVSIIKLINDKDSDQKELMKSLKFSSTHLMNIINAILDFSKLEAGKITLDYNAVALKSLIEEIANSYGFTARQKGLKFSIEIDPTIDKMVLTDEVRLTQILSNLLNNALKFTHEGEIKVSATILEKFQNNSLIEFKVTDTGIGIPEEDIPKVLESFSQLSNNITKNYGGSGLGLNIVIELLKLFDAQLSVKSTPDNGSVFSFNLLLNETKELEQLQIIEPSKIAEKINVLVVDDYQLNILVLQKTLENWGVEVETATSGEEAISKCSNNEFDIIFMDIHMPEMDGAEASRRIKNLYNYQNTPIYALTADITALNQKGNNHIFNGFLNKPLENDKIYEAVRQVSIKN